MVIAAGAGSDLTIRMVADKMSPELKRNMVIENRPGASGAIAADIVAKAAPDGYTLLVGTSSTMIMLPAVNPRLSYDPVRDFTAIGQMTQGNVLIVVRSSLPVYSLADLIKHAKANPGKLSYGTAGVGTTTHLAAEWLSLETGIEMLHVPYKSMPAASSDLVTDRVDMVFDNVAPALISIKTVKARPIVIASKNRAAALSDTPTTMESGYPWLEIGTWSGLFAPKGTPKPIVDQLNGELKRILAMPEIIEGLRKIGNEINYNTPEQLSAYTKDEIDKWRRVVKSRNLKFDD